MDPENNDPVAGTETVVTGAGATVSAEQLGVATTAAAVTAPVVRRTVSQVDRYVLLGRVGSGGMGVVYRAYDPDLDRKVAIKLLAVAGAGAEALRERLLREGQALAKVSHPNVVSVYDVGSAGDDVFIAMELVEGETLREWLAAQPRTSDEILDLFLAAGEGLAAAHRVGLVHRDFKPDNVVVDKAGQPRVLDFGIARATGGAEPAPLTQLEPNPDTTESVEPLPMQRNRFQTPLTNAGDRLGTPMYMAPEQHEGRTVDERADQFAFAVALWEALYKVLPYPAETYVQLLSSLRQGRPSEPPPTSVAPWLRGVLERALTFDPATRYGSLHELLATISLGLRRDRARPVRRRRIAASIGAGLVVTSIIAVVTLTSHHKTAPCEEGAAQLAGVWDDGARSAVRARFANTGPSYVGAATNQLVAMLNDYARRWVVKQHDVCAATNIQHKQSAQLMDQRMACLDARRTDLMALVQGLTDRKNSATVDGALSATGQLLALEACDDIEHFGPTVVLPADPAEAREVREIRTEISKVSATIALGEVAAAKPLAKALAERADRTGFVPVRAQTADLYTYALLEAEDFGGVEPLLQSMVMLGAQAKNDVVVATGWIELMRLRGSTQARTADALAMRFAAEAAMHRAGDNPRNEREFYSTLADIYDIAADYPSSRDAEQHLLDLVRKVYGARHFMVGGVLLNLGATEFSLGNLEQALAYFNQALAIYEEQLGPDNPRVARALTNIAEVMTQKNQPDKALPMLQRALQIKERALGPDHRNVALTVLAISDAYVQERRYADALPLARRSYAILSAALAADHPHVATAATSLGQVLIRLGQYDEGCALVAKAEPILVKTYQLDGAARTELYQAECAIHGGHASAAVELLAPVITALDVKKDPELAGLLRFRRAQAMAEATGHPTAQSTSLAKEAEALFIKAGDAGTADLTDLHAWLLHDR